MKNSSTSKFAYASALFFFVGIAASFALIPPEGFDGIPQMSVVMTRMAFIFFHLAMLPVIAALPSPAWAKASGFAWVVFDNVLEIVSLFGIGSELIVPMRWGIHLATATWILGVSLEAHGVLKWLGFVLTLALTGTTLYGPFIENREIVGQTLGPSALLLIVWIIIAGLWLSKSEVANQK